MNENIVMKKLWHDPEMSGVLVTCCSSVASVITETYITDSMIDDLINSSRQFLGGCTQEVVWGNLSMGTTIPCVSFRFFRKDRAGHICVEVYVEIEDGGSYKEHNSCFYLGTDYWKLLTFCEKLEKFKNEQNGFEIVLNDEC